MYGLKPLLLCLLAGSSAGFALKQPSPVTTTALRMSGGAGTPPPELKVSFATK